MKLQGSIPKAFVCLVWGNGNAWLFRKERGRELWYKVVAKLLKTSDLVWIYSILKSVRQILLCASVRERSPFSFSCEGTFRVAIIPRSIPLSYGIRRLCTDTYVPKYTASYPKIRESSSSPWRERGIFGVPDMMSFEWHRANEIWFKLHVFDGMLQEDSHLHGPATDIGPLCWDSNLTACDIARSSQRTDTVRSSRVSLINNVKYFHVKLMKSGQQRLV